MKRGAENQLTKDEEEDEASQDMPEDGFKKADEATLSTRKMRSLPKRSMAGTSTASVAVTNGTFVPEPASSKPKFTGFAGFDQPSNSFSFASHVPPVSSPPPSVGPSSFTSSTPAVASTASNTTKTFASFLGDTPAKQSKADTSNVPMQEDLSGATQTTGTEDTAVLKYYTSLRGLNVSLLSALSQAVESNPFDDLANILEEYKSLRLNVQRDYDEIPKTAAPSPALTAPSRSTAMPAPPSAFSGFGPLKSTPSTSSGKSGGFVPSVSATTPLNTGFSFPQTVTTATALPPSSSKPSTTASPFPLASGSSNISTSGFQFGTSASGKSFSSSSFSFADPPPNSTSGTNPFGNTNTPGSKFFSLDKPAVTGIPAGTAAGSFGGFGSFGKLGGGVGSIGNSVGFGFGSPTGTSESNTAGASDKKAETGNNETQEPEQNPPTGGLFGSSPHDEEGEGEEQEETVHSVKLKAFRLRKEEEKGGSGWVELGYGVLRLKKHKHTGARRVLLRNSSTGKVNINFNIYPGLKPSQAKKTLTFVGHDEGISQTYNVRLQSEEQVASLKDALEKEIASVKSKSDS